MTHTVTMKQPRDKVVNSDVEFIIKRDKSKIGTLKISKGNLVWVPSGNHVNTYRIPWRKVAQLLEGDRFLVKKATN